ncbi:hypothetical protein [Rufibacter tibetensis]|nr:hypothetical protein [Rufibacter tibetensis]
MSEAVKFGRARGELILVGFAEGMSLQARQQVLGRFPQFQSVEGEIAVDSGIITVVRLAPGSECSDVEKLLTRLVKESSISFANPFFESNSTDPEAPITGLSNEILVFIEEGSLDKLEQLVAQTNTKIVASYSDEIHVLSVDKNSSGSILNITTLLNQQAFVLGAEPNLVYSFPATATSGGEINFQTTKTRRK